MKTESKATYTPGPWRIHATDIVGANAAVVVDCLGAMGGDDTDADKRLIAAAPELLAACQSLMRAEGMQRGDRDGCTMGEISQAIDAARAAIAKALGHE